MFTDKLLPNLMLTIFPQLLLCICLLIGSSRIRKLAGAIVLVVMAVAFGFVIGNNPTKLSFLFAFFAVYQLVNTTRIVENRLTIPHLRREVLRTGVTLLVVTSLIVVLQHTIEDPLRVFWPAAPFILTVLSVSVFATTVWSIAASRTPASKKFLTDEELPTLSVLIPARNEDAELSDCIYALTKSSYPKLEIIVLDDCSKDASSDIIKRFAHAGVRFIQGDTPSPKWLAKNQAYETLAAAASGDWLVFTGVDVRLDPAMLRNLIAYALTHERKMVSVLPTRINASVLTSFLMPLRYWWELAIPRGLVGRPSVLSTCWAIEKKTYKKLGGLAAYAQTINPESLFARELYAAKKYSFLRSTPAIKIETTKSLKDQYETAIRTRYPQLHRQIENAAFVSLAIMVLWFWPYAGFVAELINGNVGSAILYAAASLSLLISHLLIVYYTNKSGIFAALINFPYSLLQEICLINISLYKYEFSEVVWKGRNICYPIMHITPRLPDMDGGEETHQVK